MNGENTKHNIENEPFEYRIFKDKIQIRYHGKPVMMLKGSESKKLILKIEKAEDKEVQLILAKITGNFKRGNEKIKNTDRK
ncbi:MAG TPA: hypothetical protein PKA90_15565 [Ignavibacteria bacterium]|nr:hypothetical protein [Ignavibacteria bacterium]HMR41836.1 hypothetical protein [Ignavibacteria bacterium]